MTNKRGRPKKTTVYTPRVVGEKKKTLWDIVEWLKGTAKRKSFFDWLLRK
jgi:hypothetical protein|tara:strand:+ start:212 stop:361 length:150 start_codon:yes stop_codon:yes gene_type:complete